MFCPKCGTQVLEEAEFCQKCGTKLIENDTTSQRIEMSGRQVSVAAENTQAPLPNAVKAGKRHKFVKYGLVCFGVVLVIMVVALLKSGGENDKYIQMVKGGTLEAYPQKTVGEAFDGYLGNPKWESGISEDGARFVNITGKIFYYDKETDLLVQFIIDNDELESFSYYACELNGVPQDNFFFLGLLEAVYNGDELSSAENSSGYVPGENSIMIGETRSISVDDGEMEVTLDSIEFTDGPISFGYNNLTPDDGFTYLVASLTVKNTGTTETGLFTMGSTVIYDGKYEYTTEGEIGENISNLDPLSNAKTAAIIFMVPKSAAESEDALVINISTGFGGDDISYTIRAGSNTATQPLDIYEIMDLYEGSWTAREYDSVVMKNEYVDANGGYLDISISWGIGTSELTEWQLTGIYDEEDSSIHYTGTRLEWYVEEPDGGAGTRVVSEEENGVIWIEEDGLLYWVDYTKIPPDVPLAFQKSAY